MVSTSNVISTGRLIKLFYWLTAIRGSETYGRVFYLLTWTMVSISIADEGIAWSLGSLLKAGWNGRTQGKPRLTFCVRFFPVLSQAESWQRLYNDTRSLFPVVLEQLDDYNAKLSDLQESLIQALDHVRDTEDMNRATAAKQRDHEVQWTL